MKIPGWVRTVGKWLAMAAGAVALALVVRRHGAELVARLVDAVAPDRKRGWRRVPGDQTSVDVLQPEGEAVRVKLPEGVTVDDVRAIGASREGWTVEVLHTARDRRSAARG